MTSSLAPITIEAMEDFPAFIQITRTTWTLAEIGYFIIIKHFSHIELAIYEYTNRRNP